MSRRWPVALLTATLLLSSFTGAQFGGSDKGPEATAVKSDIRYIKCEVCQLVAKQAHRQVKAAEKDLKPGKKLKEYDVIEMIEKITNPLKDEGEWITTVDLVESGDKLLVKEMKEQGKCGTECKTVQRAAEQIVESADTDMAEKLWQGTMLRSQFTNWLCQSATSACKQKAPKLPEDRPIGPAFEAVDPEEARMQKMMATMKEMGMGGQVFNRDQAARMAQDGGGDEDDYDDYADDSSLPSDMGVAQPSEAAPTRGTQNIIGQATSAAQAGVEAAVGVAAEGWKAAKDAGSKLFSHAQNLFGTGKPEPVAAEL